MPSGNSDDSFPGALRRPGRRDLLKWLGVGAAAGIAGCSGGSNTSNEPTGNGSSTSESSSTSKTSSSETTMNQSATPDVQGAYNSAVSSDASTLDFLHESSTSEGGYVNLTMDYPWAIQKGPEIFPLMITPSSDDKRVWKMKLRENLKWSDKYGQMTAEDWVYNIKNIFQADWTGYVSPSYFTGTNPDSGKTEPVPVEKTGKYSFNIKLFEEDPLYPFKPNMWGTWILPKGLLKKYVPKQDIKGLKQDKEFNTLSFTGNLGPYKYEKWDRKSQYKVTRNDDYYLREVAKNDDKVGKVFENAPYFESYTYHVINEQSARLGALQKGTIDDAAIPSSKVKKYQNMDSVKVYRQPQPYVYAIKYNMRKNGWKPFRKKEVRQALACAVDKKTILQGAWRNYGKIAQTMQPAWSKWYSDSGITHYGVGDNYGKKITQKKLSAALKGTEYEYDGDKLVDGNGSQVSLSLLYNPGTSSPKKTVCQLVKQGFENNAGIKVDLKTVPGPTFVNKYAHNSPPKGTDVSWSSGPYNGGPRDVSVSEKPWDMSFVYSLNTYPLTPSTAISPFFVEKGSFNYYGYVPSDDSSLDDVYQQAQKVTDTSKLKQLYGKLFDIVNDEQPYGFLAMPADFSGTNPKLVGPQSSFFSGWNFQAYHFKST